jgi:hypothetical protein
MAAEMGRQRTERRQLLTPIAAPIAVPVSRLTRGKPYG